MRLPHASRFSKRGHHGRWQRGLGCKRLCVCGITGARWWTNECGIEVRGSHPSAQNAEEWGSLSRGESKVGQPPANNVTWTVSNPSLATITTANPTVLTATAAGTLTLTATSESVSAQAQITISPANTVFPAGTILWSDPPAPGFTAMQIAQAVPTATGPDLYSTSVSADGTQSIIQALQADGEQLWQIQTPAVLNNSAVPDGFGGLIVTSCPSGNPMTVSDFGPTGQLLWQELAAGVNTGNGTITYLCGAPYIAVRGDGAVVVTEATNVGLPSVTVNGEMYSIPPSTVTNAFGTTIDVLCCVGPPMVNTDGTTYLEYEVRNVVGEVVTSDTLYLMQINPDNSSSSTILSATTQNETQYPGNIIPDGQGGVLATWSVSVVQGTQPTYPYEAVDFSGGTVGTPYNLPFSPQSVDITKQPNLVLGQNGTTFAKGQTTTTINGVNTTVDQIASFNISSGAANWTYRGAQGSTLSILAAIYDGSLSINDSQNGVIQLGTSGNPTQISGNLGGASQYSWTGQWYQESSQGPGSLILPLDADYSNTWAMPNGNPSQNGAAIPICPCESQETGAAPGFNLSHLTLPDSLTPGAPPASGLKYVLLVGDPGLNTSNDCTHDPEHCHNVGQLFNFAASTQSDSLGSSGNTVVTQRISTVQDFNSGLTTNGTITGGVAYFGHAAQQAQTDGSYLSILAAGQGSGVNTNVSALNVNLLSNAQIPQGVTLTLNACNAGLPPIRGGGHSIAQLVANQLNRTVYAWKVGMFFSQDPTARFPKKPDPQSTPIYMIPLGGNSVAACVFTPNQPEPQHCGGLK